MNHPVLGPRCRKCVRAFEDLHWRPGPRAWRNGGDKAAILANVVQTAQPDLSIAATPDR
ncbi:DUF1810 domain-containing protein [Sphingobium lignivorans]|uniref:DUF1810 domain-containing protein n=1 Tax=Sphingobium lignivorans TaxID=2735886 RepID=UPI0021AA0F50|nr:DUF1810 domain-containing protein [Sphingobium lignivorans]